MIKYVLGEIADVRTGPFGTQLKASEYVSDGIPIINVKNIGFGNLIKDDMDYVDLSTCKRLEDHILKENDIVFGRKGSVDRHCIIRNEEEGWLQGSDCIRVRIHNTEVNPKYLSCYLMQEGVKRQLNNAAVGSTMASMNSNIIKSITMKLPSIEEQNIIADFFEKIHQKIENNNRINKELEAMAKTIYDYWFLQFEFPNEEGKPYKSSGGKMVWNEELKREIPEGWKVGKLNDIAGITMGSSPNGNSINEDMKGIIFYQGKTDFGYRFPQVRLYTSEPVRYAEKNDILLSVRAPVGSLNIANKKCCIGRGLAAVHSKHQSFIYYLLLANQYQLNKYNDEGTTFGAINKDDLLGLHVIIPKNDIINMYEDKIKCFDNKIFELSEENREIVSLYDFLLPLLMNGQVRFKQ